MNCVIYKGAKKPDSYLYVERDGDFSRVPPTLLKMLGELQRVMSLELDSDRKLAQADAKKVIESLVQNGYFLQMPPGTPTPGATH